MSTISADLPRSGFKYDLYDMGRHGHFSLAGGPASVAFRDIIMARTTQHLLTYGTCSYAGLSWTVVEPSRNCRSGRCDIRSTSGALLPRASSVLARFRLSPPPHSFGSIIYLFASLVLLLFELVRTSFGSDRSWSSQRSVPPGLPVLYLADLIGRPCQHSTCSDLFIQPQAVEVVVAAPVVSGYSSSRHVTCNADDCTDATTSIIV